MIRSRSVWRRALEIKIQGVFMNLNYYQAIII